ncbi:MAG: hypothetical protein GXO97_01935 [Nitrospirae bacterium]|nr:hypothetical protein [Nitrospirota bacterium]
MRRKINIPYPSRTYHGLSDSIDTNLYSIAGQGQAQMFLCRGGEVVKRLHVAIPTVTFTNNLMYHPKAEKVMSCYNLNPIASMG